jgi:hypothetical protein
MVLDDGGEGEGGEDGLSYCFFLGLVSSCALFCSSGREINIYTHKDTDRDGDEDGGSGDGDG